MCVVVSGATLLSRNTDDARLLYGLVHEIESRIKNQESTIDILIICEYTKTQPVRGVKPYEYEYVPPTPKRHAKRSPQNREAT